MMTRGIKIRLMAFVVLSAVGIVYVTPNYLGLVDRVLGRGITVHATLPNSGGLFVGSAVTYHGPQAVKVRDMQLTTDGPLVDIKTQNGSHTTQHSTHHHHNHS